MLNVFIAILICAVLFAGAFYAAHYMVKLQTADASKARDIEEAKVVIAALEQRVEMLEFERDDNARKIEQRLSEKPGGWSAFEGRSNR